ncbi:MAG TPA: aryl-sulfate sulfotransferase [Terriglobia bacterium]|nr:aryl-sulfate sulfotransferase [Terriglobia bacterium]
MQKKANRVFRTAFILGLAGVVLACGNSTYTPPSSTSSPAALVSVSVSPASVIVGTSPSASTQLTANVRGSSNGAVTWSVNSIAGGNATVGTISPSGLYTSPAAPTSAVMNITATSAADPTKSSSSSVVLVTSSVSSTQNPQVAQYSFTAPTTAVFSVQFGTDTSYGLQTWSQHIGPSGGNSIMLVAGMRANTTYHMRISASFAGGVTYLDADHTFATGGLSSARIPPMTVTTPTSGLSPAGGVEMLNLAFVGSNQIEAAVTDLQGNIIWYYDFPTSNGTLFPFPMKPLSNGHILVTISGEIAAPPPDANLLQEIDLAGNVVRQISMTQLNQELASAGFNLVGVEMHHDVAVLPNGHWVVIVQTYKDFTDLTGYPGVTHVAGDALVDLDQNFNPVWVWNSFDYLDVNRHPFDLPDWTHSNAIIYSPSDGNLVLSMRNQSWLLKIDYANGSGTGNVLWHLGPGGDFTLTGGAASDWFYNQHYPIFLSSPTTGDFQLGLFDNGNERPDPVTGLPCEDATGAPGGGTCYSRAPILEVNETTKTASVVWEDKAPGFSLCCGNLQLLSNGDGEYDLATSTQAPPWDAHVYEMTHEDSPRTVWELEMPGTLAYRAFRIPSLYPGVQW